MQPSSSHPPQEPYANSDISLTQHGRLSATSEWLFRPPPPRQRRNSSQPDASAEPDVWAGQFSPGITLSWDHGRDLLASMGFSDQMTASSSMAALHSGRFPGSSDAPSSSLRSPGTRPPTAGSSEDMSASSMWSGFAGRADATGAANAPRVFGSGSFDTATRTPMQRDFPRSVTAAQPNEAMIGPITPTQPSTTAQTGLQGLRHPVAACSVRAPLISPPSTGAGSGRLTIRVPSPGLFMSNRNVAGSSAAAQRSQVDDGMLSPRSRDVDQPSSEQVLVPVATYGDDASQGQVVVIGPAAPRQADLDGHDISGDNSSASEANSSDVDHSHDAKWMPLGWYSATGSPANFSSSLDNTPASLLHSHARFATTSGDPSDSFCSPLQFLQLHLDEGVPDGTKRDVSTIDAAAAAAATGPGSSLLPAFSTPAPVRQPVVDREAFLGGPMHASELDGAERLERRASTSSQPLRPDLGNRRPSLFGASRSLSNHQQISPHMAPTRRPSIHRSKSKLGLGVARRPSAGSLTIGAPAPAAGNNGGRTPDVPGGVKRRQRPAAIASRTRSMSILRAEGPDVGSGGSMDSQDADGSDDHGQSSDAAAPGSSWASTGEASGATQAPHPAQSTRGPSRGGSSSLPRIPSIRSTLGGDDSANADMVDADEAESPGTFDDLQFSFDEAGFHGVLLGVKPLETLATRIRQASSSKAKVDLLEQFATAWMNHFYEEDEHGTVNRAHMNQSYRAACKEYKLPALNPSAFGRQVRTRYPNISTRRLGPRGNSRYHYTGLAAKYVDCDGNRYALKLNDSPTLEAKVESKPESASKAVGSNSTAAPRRNDAPVVPSSTRIPSSSHSSANGSPWQGSIESLRAQSGFHFASPGQSSNVGMELAPSSSTMFMNPFSGMGRAEASGSTSMFGGSSMRQSFDVHSTPPSFTSMNSVSTDFGLPFLAPSFDSPLTSEDGSMHFRHSTSGSVLMPTRPVMISHGSFGQQSDCSSVPDELARFAMQQQQQHGFPGMQQPQQQPAGFAGFAFQQQAAQGHMPGSHLATHRTMDAGPRFSDSFGGNADESGRTYGNVSGNDLFAFDPATNSSSAPLVNTSAGAPNDSASTAHMHDPTMTTTPFGWVP